VAKGKAVKKKREAKTLIETIEVLLFHPVA
jgi:hypothetical protein